MRRCVRTSSQAGSALLFVILLLFLVSGLAAAMVASSSTDTTVSRNGESAAQAQAAAEAGLNHAIDSSRTYLRAWESNFTNTNDAVSRLLRGPDDDAVADADNGSLAWLAGGTPTPPATVGLGGLSGVSYSVRIFDDDDPALGNNWTEDDLVRADEGDDDDPDPTVDHNGVFVVRATGIAPDQTRVVVESVMKPLPWPAIVTNGNLDMSGGPQVLGDGGSVHANGSVSEIGNAAVVQHDVTAAGDVTTHAGWTPVEGRAEGGQLPISIPSVNVADFIPLARYRLGNDGQIYNAATSVAICSSNAACAALGFNWSSVGNSRISHMAHISRTWNPGGTPDCATLNASLTAAGIATPNCGQGVYYADASDVEITGNLGRTTNPAGTPSPYAMTILAEGSVSISGTPHIVPAIALPNILIVTNGDLEMTGTANCVISGQARIREQLNLAGTMALTGQLIVENRWDLSDEVTGDSKLAGNATITNDRLAVYDFAVGGWREFRR